MRVNLTAAHHTSVVRGILKIRQCYGTHITHLREGHRPGTIRAPSGPKTRDQPVKYVDERAFLLPLIACALRRMSMFFYNHKNEKNQAFEVWHYDACIIID